MKTNEQIRELKELNERLSRNWLKAIQEIQRLNKKIDKLKGEIKWVKNNS